MRLPPPNPPGIHNRIAHDRKMTNERSAFEFLHQTVRKHFAGRPTPSLLPAGS
ncbi:MAG: hypothetical protein ACP5VQ_03925 [Phycisphaerae bacterium]